MRQHAKHIWIATIGTALVVMLAAGCQSVENRETVKEEGVVATELEIAQHRLDAAEKKLDATRFELKRIETRSNWPPPAEDAIEDTIQIQRLSFEVDELDKSLRSLQANHIKLTEDSRAGIAKQDAGEIAAIESGQIIKDIDTQLEQLKEARAEQLANFGGHEIIMRIDEQIELIKIERKKEVDERYRILIAAKLEQSALGLQILKEELDKTNEALAEWKEVRVESARLVYEYERLQRLLKLAEAERDIALRAVQELKANKQSTP